MLSSLKGKEEKPQNDMMQSFRILSGYADKHISPSFVQQKEGDSLLYSIK